MVELAIKKIEGCTACYKFFETKDVKCSVKNDIVNDCIEKMVEADGIVVKTWKKKENEQLSL